jgi:phytoene synthase
MEIIDGMAMNLDYDVYPSFQELTLHCHRVNGTLGIIAAQILGYQDQATRSFASKLGVALQLLGNLRTTRSDALKGRVNLPADELQRLGVAPRDLLEPQTPERVRKLFQRQADHIRNCQNQGFEQLSERDRAPQQSHIILANLAMALLQEIEADRFRVLEHRIALTPLRKLWLAWNTRRREERRRRLGSTENT